MTVKEHYNNHLGNFYAWMVGDFENEQNKFSRFLNENNLSPRFNKIALDLGAGHGVQSIALARMGYSVIAIDFSKQLLEELKNKSNGLDIQIMENDIFKFSHHIDTAPELILCWGDTLTHLEDKISIEKFIYDAGKKLEFGGKIVLSFRDYSKSLTGNERFIPVKSDDERILTCFLEYKSEIVQVTDLLYEKIEGKWLKKISSYNKVRVRPTEILNYLSKASLKIDLHNSDKGMVTIIATKK